MFLIVILPLFAASIVILVNVRTIIKEQALDTAVEITNFIEYRMNDVITAVDGVVNIASSNNAVLSYLSADSLEAADEMRISMDNYCTQFLKVAPQLNEIYIYTSKPELANGSNVIYADQNITSADWYKKAIENSDSTIWEVVEYPQSQTSRLSCIKAVKLRGKIIGITAAAISDEWIGRFIPDEQIKTIISVNDGKVFFSNFVTAAVGSTINPDSDFSLNDITKTYDYGFWDFEGYTVLNCFNVNSNFQIVLLLPKAYISHDLNRLSVIYGGYCGLMIILSMLIIILFTSIFSRRIKLLSEKTHAVANGDFKIKFNDTGNDEISDLYTDLGQMIVSMQSMMDDIYKVKLQNEAFKFDQMEAEFKALASQINPHFLYNTLETIRMKAYCNNDKETADLIKKLGKFMRRCLEFKDGEVTLRSELEFTNGYLELQSARFGDRVSYSIYSEVSKDYMILPLVIQPVVENAFVHGIEGSKANGRIDIKVYYHNQFVNIDVTDNGTGITDERLEELREKLRKNDTSSGKSIGLTNVNKRIKMYHGEQYGLSVATEEGEGTTVRITLPREHTPRLLNTDENS